MMKTKTIALTVIALAFAGALGMYITRDKVSAPQAQGPALEETGLTAVKIETDTSMPVAAAGSAAQASPPATPQGPDRRPASEPSAAKDPAAVIFDQAVRTLISPQTTYQEKQVAWGHIRGAGKYDQLISELEQRFASQPMVPEVPAALGQAYLQKAGSISDLREQGILGMKADQSFEAALNLDGANWEARYWKAKALSYWPAEMGKGKEVIEHCLELLKQQEVLPPQEQFAETYVLLGEQYQKQGQPEYASQAWKRGLGLFPSSGALSRKFAAQQQ